MTYLVATVVFVGALSVLNLLLLLGLARRLREQRDLVAGAGPTQAMLPDGAQVGRFSVRTTSGTSIDEGNLVPGMAVAFFSLSCAPCKALMPEFLDWVDALPNTDERVLVIVADGPVAGDETVDPLSAKAPVVAGADAAVLMEAFRTTSFPTIYVMGTDATVAHGGRDLSVLAAPVR